MTVVQLFERIVVGYGEHVALKAKRGGEWRNWTYRAYFEESSVVAKAFIEASIKVYCLSLCLRFVVVAAWPATIPRSLHTRLQLTRVAYRVHGSHYGLVRWGAGQMNDSERGSS